MEIAVATERAFVIPAAVSWPQARERAWDKKIQVFASGIGGFLNRPKAEDVEITYSELRYEPFWHLLAGSRFRYERSRQYRVPVHADEVTKVTILGQEFPVAPGKDPRDPRGLTLPAVEYCEEDVRVEKYYEGVGGEEKDYAAMLKLPNSEIPDLSSFAPSESIVVPPQVRAMTIVRGVMGSLFRPVQADKVYEEHIAVDAVDLYFKPVYAFEYRWKTKDKTAVAEFDAMSGEMRVGGRTVRDQIRGVLSQDLLFDVTADAVSMFVPGGSIAVKLARAGARKALGS